MTASPKPCFSPLIYRAYSDAYAHHGDLALTLEIYARHLDSIIDKHLGPASSTESADAFSNGLHTNDLYLAAACAQSGEAAWQRFHTLYYKHIQVVSRSACSTAEAARELAEELLGHLFMPDASGRSRMASYDGRSSLATWLSVIINHRAIKARQRKYNRMERLEDLPEMADTAVMQRIELELRADKYQSLITDSFTGASNGLSERERFILALRYKDGLQGTEIAGILGVHPSTVTRHLQQIYEKLRERVLTILAAKYRLLPSAIDECLADIIENPAYSVFSMI